MNDSAPPRLYLTDKTFVALTDETLVFLDLHRDKYSCLERKYTKPVIELFGLRTPSHASVETRAISGTECLNDIESTIRRLIESGLATWNSEHGKRAALISVHGELREMLGYVPGEGPSVRIHHITNFLKSLIVSRTLLRFASLEYTVTRVKRRKEKFFARGGDEKCYEYVNELVEVYKMLKPLFVTLKDECLFNSFFLIEFLACYRIYPSWYFGVRLNEFYAHCWVQGGNVIYDDFIQSTSANQPIMVI